MQDAVAHDSGLGENWKPRRAFWADRTKNETVLRTNLLSLATTRTRHVGSDPAGLTNGQFAILTQLATWPSGTNPSVADLARALVLDRTALTRALQPLVRDGLIQLAHSPQDQRARLVRLTGTGRKRLVEASELWVQAQDKYARAVGERQAVALRALSQIFAEAELDG